MEVKESSQTIPPKEARLHLLRDYVGIVRELWKLLSQWCTATTLWIGLVLPTIFINILSLAFPLILLQAYDRVIPHQSFYTLAFLIIGGIIAIGIGMVLSILRSVSINWTSARFEYFTNCKIFHRLMTSQLNEFQKEGSGYYLKRIDDVLHIKDYYLNQVLTNLLDLPFVILFVALIAHISTYLALIPIVMIIVLLFSTSRQLKELGKHIENKHEEDSRRWSFLANTFAGSKTLKSMVSEPLMLRRYERLLNNSLEESKLISSAYHSVQGTSRFIQYGTSGLVILVGGTMLLSGNISLGALAASVLLAGRAIQPVHGMISLWQQYQAIPVAKKSVEILESFPIEKSGKSAGAKTLEVTQGDIVFDHVSFQYEKNNPILRDINLHVAPREIIGISGTNYSGKSTFLELMLGLFDPTEGKIRIDGRNIADYDKSKLRSKIAYLPSRGQLFHGTLLENITLFRPEKIELALKLSDHFGLSELIWPLPNGFETLVGGGFNEILSRGVVQVISTIRALITEPKILLSDEANAQLDLRTDKIFINILKEINKDCTIIIVSHRPSTLALADRQFHLTNGQLILNSINSENKNHEGN